MVPYYGDLDIYALVSSQNNDFSTTGHLKSVIICPDYPCIYKMTKMVKVTKEDANSLIYGENLRGNSLSSYIVLTICYLSLSLLC